MWSDPGKKLKPSQWVSRHWPDSMSASQSLWNALKPQLRYISRDRRAGGAGNLTVGCAGFASSFFSFFLGAASALTAAWLSFFAFAFFFFRARRFAAQ